MASKDEKVVRILARVIIEMLGGPKEHIDSTMKKYVQKLKADKDLKISREEIAESTPQGKLFSAFAELDIWFNSPVKLIDFCFDSMPSSVEIIEPDKINFSAGLLSDTLNDLQAKIHRNDMIIKTLRAKNLLLDRNGKNVLKNFVVYQVKEGDKSLDELARNLGMQPEGLKPFLDEMVSESKISEKEGKYGRAGKGAKKED